MLRIKSTVAGAGHETFDRCGNTRKILPVFLIWHFKVKYLQFYASWCIRQRNIGFSIQLLCGFSSFWGFMIWLVKKCPEDAIAGCDWLFTGPSLEVWFASADLQNTSPVAGKIAQTPGSARRICLLQWQKTFQCRSIDPKSWSLINLNRAPFDNVANPPRKAGCRC